MVQWCFQASPAPKCFSGKLSTRHWWFSPQTCCCLLTKPSIHTKPYFSREYPHNSEVPPLLHGLLIQSVLHFNRNCKLFAVISELLLQLISSLHSIPSVSKGLQKIRSHTHIDTIYLIKLLGRKPMGKISALKNQISPEQTQSFDEPRKDSD